MQTVFRIFVFSLLGLIGPLTSLRANPQWNMQYLYDVTGANFDIRDIACPTAQRCVAAGVITDRKQHEQGAVVVTSDGGAHWTLSDLRERPVSLFFLNDTLGWMVTEHGLWATDEGGQSWKKIDDRKDILETHFLDANHGYIAGASGLLEETTDGGKKWAPLAVQGDPGASARKVNYDTIAFAGQHGIIVGEVDPEGDHQFLERSADGKTEAHQSRAIIIETLDGGKKWVSGSLNLDADLGRLRISPRGFVVALVVYRDPKSPIASAVFKTSLGKSDSKLIFGERNRTPTDVAIFPNGGGVLAAVEPPGATPDVPVPGKLKMFESNDLKLWQEMDVDYRAVAQAAVIAVADPQHIWVATDTGAILSLATSN